MDSPVGFPLSGNPQTPESPNNGIPLSQNSQSSESPTSPPAFCNGSPAIFTPEEMHDQLATMPFNETFFRYMREGRCKDYFNGWFSCVHHAVYNADNARCCFWLAGVLRDCMLENYDYYQPLLSRFRRRASR